MVILSLTPHLYFLYKRGGEWNGTFPLTHDDEITYASYVSALIDGRPRRSDPYTGRDDAPSRRQAETYMSIQFLPPFVLATLARALRLESLQVFFALTLAAAAASTLAVYWMLRPVLPEESAAAAAVALLCLGSVSVSLVYPSAGGDLSNHLAFLRRYVPALPLPLIFLFCGSVWRALAAEKLRRALALAAAAAVCFTALVYSYFYLWTAALAWLFCVAVLCAAAGGRGRAAI